MLFGAAGAEGWRGGGNAKSKCDSNFLAHKAGRLASWLQDQTPPATCCSNCDQFATHVCFPCSHLCLCLACAEDLIRSTGRGFQEVLPADRSDAPTERPSCPLCGQFVFCVIDAKPAKVFEVPGPLDMAVSAAAAAASSLRRTAATAARGAAFQRI